MLSLSLWFATHILIQVTSSRIYTTFPESIFVSELSNSFIIKQLQKDRQLTFKDLFLYPLVFFSLIHPWIAFLRQKDMVHIYRQRIALFKIASKNVFLGFQWSHPWSYWSAPSLHNHYWHTTVPKAQRYQAAWYETWTLPAFLARIMLFFKLN